MMQGLQSQKNTDALNQGHQTHFQNKCVFERGIAIIYI